MEGEDEKIYKNNQFLMLPENYVVEIPGSCSLKISKPTEAFTILKCFRLPTMLFLKKKSTDKIL